MKTNVQILPPDINLPGLILVFFENPGSNPDNPGENQYHFVLYRNNDVVGGLVIHANEGVSLKIRQFSLHYELPHHYLCKKLAGLAHRFIHEKGFLELEIDVELEGTPYYEMLQNELNEIMKLHPTEELHI